MSIDKVCLWGSGRLHIQFLIVSKTPQPLEPKDHFVVYISQIKWNDYGFETKCSIRVQKPGSSTTSAIGTTRIAYKGQTSSAPWSFSNGPTEFTDLREKDADYFSVSDSMGFYRALAKFGEEFAIDFLEKICDVNVEPDSWELYKNEEVFKTSLMRSHSTVLQIRDDFPTLFGNQSEIVNDFTYEVALEGADSAHRLKFDFSYDEVFPYRVNLVTGLNGTGKTQVFSRLALALTGFTEDNPEESKDTADDVRRRKIMDAGSFPVAPSFYSVIAVSFSAFDDFELPKQKMLRKKSYEKSRYSYCGLRERDGSLKNFTSLLSELKQVTSDLSKKKKKQLSEVLRRVFPQQDARFLLLSWGDGPSNDTVTNDDLEIYQSLSAGQKIILNIIVHLCCRLNKRTLVLLDEPETHLHPMLMASLITTINDLLEWNDSYAIIASHSPIIAQQIPSRRIQILGRDGTHPFTLPPDIECFGENLSIITSSLFGAIEGERDYTSIIDDLLDDEYSRAIILERIDKLGTNAQMYLRSKLREIDA